MKLLAGIAIKVLQGESGREKAGHWKMDISALSHSRDRYFN